MIKRVGISRRLSRGKKLKGVSDAEAWVHEPAMREQLRRAAEWAKRTPPAQTKLEQLVAGVGKRVHQSR